MTKLIFVFLMSMPALATDLDDFYSFLISRAESAKVLPAKDERSYQRACESQIQRAYADGELKISLAFGYMDVSGNPEHYSSENSRYRIGQVLDPAAKRAFERVLVRPCMDLGIGESEVCGFRKRGGRFTKRVRHGRVSTQVTVTLFNGARSESDSRNQGNARQLRQSEQARNQFHSALQTQDAVIYMGHARSGGGPDFFPPRYSHANHVNYPWYRSNRPGIGPMLSVLRSAAQPAPIIGLLACKSTGLFSRSVRSVAPRSLLITADHLFDYNEIIPTSFAVLEALLSKQCGADFTRVVRSSVTNPSSLNIFR